MSHELRTPMHAVINFAKIGEMRIDRWSKDEQVENLERISISGDRLSKLLNNLLDLSKLESGVVDYDLKPIEFMPVINNVVNELHSLLIEKSLHIEIKILNEQIIVECDREKIYQVILNLLSKAIKFTGKNTSIVIEQSILKNKLSVSVCDEGVGIPENQLEQIFDKFIQSNQTKTGAGGTGLGLSICKEIIEAHKGEIWAKNNETGGSTLTFVIPLTQVDELKNQAAIK